MSGNRTWLLRRLAERSTWLGITGCLASLGIVLVPELQEAIAGLGVAAASLIAILTADKPDLGEDRHDE